jgi:hypothetical protein
MTLVFFTVYPSNGGKQLMDVSSTDVRCYTSEESGTASTMSVAAGSTVGFTVDGNPSNLYHPGVSLILCIVFKLLYLFMTPGVECLHGEGAGWHRRRELGRKRLCVVQGTMVTTIYLHNSGAYLVCRSTKSQQ